MGKRDHHNNERSSASAKDLGYRGARLEELIREEINSVLDAEISDPRLEDTRITRVELTRDGSRARLWFTTKADGATVQLALQRAAGFLRNRLCDGLPLKRIPELRFCHDPAAQDFRALAIMEEDR